MKHAHAGPTLARPLLALLAGLALAGPYPLAQAPPEAGSQPGEAPSTDDFYEDAALVRLLELGLSDNRVEEPLRHLTKVIGPRLTGSTNLQTAIDWAEARFAELGLAARREQWGEVAVGFDRGPWKGGMVAPETREFEFLTLAWTAGTQGPVRGAARPYPASLDALNAAAGDYRGAWVVRLPRDRMPSRGDQQEIDARLEELGAAGLVRSGGSELLITSGNLRVEPDALPTRVEIRALEAHVTGLIERMDAGEAVELEFDVDNRFVPGPIPQYNVIADLVGAELPDEYVYVGGHLDSWDGAEGAQDNGTGVATTLEAARLLVAAGAKPKRTIRFVLWTGEEQGLLGSQAYVRAHPELLPRISAVLIHDGGTNYLSGIAGPEPLFPDLERAFRPVMHLDPRMPFEVVKNAGLEARGASDHAPFVRAGVPGFFWRQSGDTSYPFVHHTQNDTFENARQDYQRRSALVVAVGAYNLARLEGLLDRRDLLAPPPRRLGVFLEGTTVTGVRDGKAREAGWVDGDVVLAVDGADVTSRDELVEAMRAGEPRKTFVLKRGDETIESVIDWSPPEDEDSGDDLAGAAPDGDGGASEEQP